MKNIIGKSWRDSASLIVLTKRNSKLLSRAEDRGGVNYDILLQTRTRSASFANSVVFPGGVTESVDGSPRWLELLNSFGYTKKDFEEFHRPDSVITQIFQNNPIQRHLQLRITAIRETFEELGLLIGSRVRKEDRNGLWAGVIEDIDVKYWQDRLQKDPSDWFTLCKEHECYPDIWSLHYWSNWLTPVHLPRRFNTAFFVAAVDKKPKCLEGSAEVVNVQWLSPEEILSSGKKLQPPQTYELNRLSHVKDIQELVKFAKERSGYGVDLTYPVFIKVKDGTVSLLPGDDLYPSSVDYNDNTRNYIDQTILELRKSCYTVHRFESGKEINQLVTQNYKPKHHINMEDKSYQLLFKV
uniref:Nudix hydrolase domain-containing protein n=1 Tax=Heliothis virescens TaxID=7102 RepID=A0A2A4J515_HELVI